LKRKEDILYQICKPLKTTYKEKKDLYVINIWLCWDVMKFMGNYLCHITFFFLRNLCHITCHLKLNFFLLSKK